MRPFSIEKHLRSFWQLALKLFLSLPLSEKQWLDGPFLVIRSIFRYEH